MVLVTRLQRAYEMLAASLNLPKPSDMRVEEFYFTSTLDLVSLASMMSAGKRFRPRSGSGMAGGFRQFIMSESGVLQVHYEKVLEKGDTLKCSASLGNKLQRENITSVAA
ncbi:putative DNA helicase [Helianthus anomalus]